CWQARACSPPLVSRSLPHFIGSTPGQHRKFVRFGSEPEAVTFGPVLTLHWQPARRVSGPGGSRGDAEGFERRPSFRVFSCVNFSQLIGRAPCAAKPKLSELPR